MKSFLSKSSALLVLPVALFSFEVNFNKEFTKELMPDILSTDLMIKIESDNEEQISQRLTKFNEFIKDDRKVEKKLGNYTVRPNYKYSSNNTPKIIGYVGELRYKVSSDDAKAVNSFITSVNKLKDSRDTSILVSHLSWKVKDTTYNVALDILRLEAITWAETYARNLSEDLQKKCEVKKVNIGGQNRPVFAKALNAEVAMDSRSRSGVAVPQANHQKIAIQSNYTLECK